MKMIKFFSKSLVTVLAITLLVASVVASTFAFLKVESNKIANTFIGATADIEIDEDFTDGIHKKNVTVENTAAVPVFVRIRLVTYRVDNSGNRQGGVATIPSFSLGTDWIDAGDNLYIYKKPVSAGNSAPYLIGSTGIELKDYSKDATDPDGGKQVVEVLADAVIASYTSEIETAWNVNITDGVITGLK